MVKLASSKSNDHLFNWNELKWALVFEWMWQISERCVFSYTPIVKGLILLVLKEMKEMIEREVYSDNEMDDPRERWVVIDDALFVGIAGGW